MNTLTCGPDVISLATEDNRIADPCRTVDNSNILCMTKNVKGVPNISIINNQ